jgi:hypothetical protein
LATLSLEAVLGPGAGPRAAEALLDQLPLLRVAAARVQREAESFLHGTSFAAATARPLLAAFELDFRVLEKLVERSAGWTEAMDKGLAAGPTVQSHDPITARAAALRERQRLLLQASNSARNVHALADHLVGTRASLVEAVQTKVVRAIDALDQRLQAACRDGGSAAPSWKSVAAARSDTQLWAAQAAALVLRLQTAGERFEREAQALRGRCALVAQAGRERPRHEATLVLDASRGGLVPKMVWGEADTQSAALA